MIRNRSDSKRFVFQSAHAQLAKQIFQYIDRALLDDFAKMPEVETAIGLHDIGWAEWEHTPKINGLTGYPYDFSGIPVNDHLTIWKNCTRIVGKLNSLASLLVSMHTSYLAENHDAINDTKKEKEALKHFLENEKAFQKTLFDSLNEFKAYQNMDSNQLEIIRSWIGFCDYLSLLLCMQGFHNRLITDLPESMGSSQVEIYQVTDYENRYVIEPWIFKMNHITLQCDSIILDGPFHNTTQLDLELEMEQQRSHLLPHTTILQKQP